MSTSRVQAFLSRKPIGRVLAWLVLACLLPAVVGVALLFQREYEQGRAQLERDTIATARALVQVVDNQLAAATMTAEVLALSGSLRERDLKTFHQHARETLATTRVGMNVVLSDPSGQQLVNTIRDFGTPLARHGNVPVLNRVFQTGKPVISNIYVGGVLGKPVMSIDVPVQVAGRVEYDLSVGLQPNDFNRLLAAQHLPHGWVAAIFDPAGTIAARTHSPEQFVGQKGTAQYIERISRSLEGSMYTVTLEGIPTFSVWSRSPVTEWTVGIGIPREALERELRHSMAWLTAGMVALLALGLGLAWLVGKRISSSAQSLAAAAAAMGRGCPIPATEMDFREASEVAAEIRKADEELRRHRQHLEELVAERTAALSIARDEAQAGDRAKSAFLATMSHELRTPMNGILGMAYLLRRSGVTPHQAERIDKIESLGRHLMSILTDMLDFSKMDSEAFKLDTKDFSLGELLQELKAAIGDDARAKGLETAFEGPGVPLDLHGDPVRLRQALLNYLGNAVKFTAKGGIKFRVDLVEETGADCLLRFEVSDTGIGIPESALGGLFVPFHQVDGTSTREFGGTGLGLAMSRRIAHLMGGSVGVESTPGRGSTFWLSVRLLKPRAARDVAESTESW